MADKQITDSDLIAITDQEIKNSVGYSSGRLSEMRRKAEYFYLAEAKGELAPPEIEGRSTVVSTDVSDTIEWMLPNLLKIFTAGDNAVEFAPQRQEDEQIAKQATDYINYIFYKQNPGFQILYTWFKDALLQKNGILKVYWDNKQDDTKEEYKGLSDQELAMLLEDDAVEPISHSAYPDEDDAKQRQEALNQLTAQYREVLAAAQQGNPQAAQIAPQLEQQINGIMQSPPVMLHDVVLKRTQDNSRVAVENVPPEEFLISRRAKTIKDASFVGHRLLKTISDLRAQGYKNVDDIASDDSGSDNGERIERASWDDEVPYLDTDDSGDSSQRQVWITECYLRMDYDGDGIAEWRKVVRAGNQILDNEECDGPPFVSITPIPLPHRFFGLSIADLSMEIQKTKTSIWRALLDNLYLQVNGRYFAVNGKVNLDDLLTSRPGGVVRVDAPNMVGPLQQGMADAGSAYQALEYAEVAKENRTGFTRYSQGNTADSLNKTATGMNIITNRSDARTELVARVFAETGVKDLFLHILKLVCQYQDKETAISVGGQWVPMNPREWATQFDFTVNVGLGTGNKDQVVQHLMALIQQQGNGLQIGIATPQNIYNANTKLAENLGFKQADQFFTDPSKQPPKPPQPDPRIIEAQEKAKLEREKMQMEMQLKREQLEAEIALKRQEMQFKYLVQPQIEQQNYAALYQQSEGMVDGPIQGNQPGAAGIGGVGAPVVPGGGGVNPQQIPPGMGSQPSAGF
jgi:soluble cytochrome b562